MRLALLTTFIATTLATAAAAQDPVSQAYAEYDRSMIKAVEQMLFSKTQKTTTVIYAKRWDSPSNELQRICGEGLFGSRRQRFVVDIATNAVTRPSTIAEWRGSGCEADGGRVMLDLR